jgi:major vault protein
MAEKPRVFLIKLPPYHYLHILDKSTQITRLEVGPATMRCNEHEQIVLQPQRMHIIPPRHYCTVRNPVLRDPATGGVVLDKNGQVRLRHGDLEIRFEREDPFPLFPGESLLGEITPFKVVPPNVALRLRAHRDFEETVDTKRVVKRAGDEWLFFGPGTYIPRVEVEVLEERQATVILPGTALKLRALHACRDCDGVARKAGEQWLVRREGAYLPSVDEAPVDVIKAIVLTPKRSLRLRALMTFTDRFKRPHKKGEEWLVRHTDCEAYIPDVMEEVAGDVDVVALSSRQYCAVRDPVEHGANMFGRFRLVQGPQTFFLEPGESLVSVSQVVVLSNNQALRVRCLEPFDDVRMVGGKRTVIKRVPGSEWLVCGPCEYIPPLEVQVVSQCTAIVALEPFSLFIFERSSIITPIVIAILAILIPLIFFH